MRFPRAVFGSANICNRKYVLLVYYAFVTLTQGINLVEKPPVCLMQPQSIIRWLFTCMLHVADCGQFVGNVVSRTMTSLDQQIRVHRAVAVHLELHNPNSCSSPFALKIGALVIPGLGTFTPVLVFLNLLFSSQKPVQNGRMVGTCNAAQLHGNAVQGMCSQSENTDAVVQMFVNLPYAFQLAANHLFPNLHESIYAGLIAPRKDVAWVHSVVNICTCTWQYRTTDAVLLFSSLLAWCA